MYPHKVSERIKGFWLGLIVAFLVMVFVEKML